MVELRKNEVKIMVTNVEQELKQSNEILDLFGNVQMANENLVVRSVEQLDFPSKGELRNNEMCFYKIKQLAYDEDYPRRNSIYE